MVLGPVPQKGPGTVHADGFVGQSQQFGDKAGGHFSESQVLGDDPRGSWLADVDSLGHSTGGDVVILLDELLDSGNKVWL